MCSRTRVTRVTIRSVPWPDAVPVANRTRFVRRRNFRDNIPRNGINLPCNAARAKHHGARFIRRVICDREVETDCDNASYAEDLRALFPANVPEPNLELSGSSRANTAPRSRRAPRQRGPMVSLHLSLFHLSPPPPSLRVDHTESKVRVTHTSGISAGRLSVCSRARTRVHRPNLRRWELMRDDRASGDGGGGKARHNFRLTKSPGTVNEMKVVFLRASISDSWPVLFPTALTNNPDQRIDAGLSRGGSRDPD